MCVGRIVPKYKNFLTERLHHKKAVAGKESLEEVLDQAHQAWPFLHIYTSSRDVF